MAFCNSCGATIDAGASACPACGKAIGGAAPSPAAAPAGGAAPATQPKGGGGALKIILLVMGGLALVIFVIAALAVGAAYYVAQRSHVEQGPEGAKVETPFGSVETSNQGSEKIAEQMGIEVYPGARGLPGAASVTLGSAHTATAAFESDDPPEKVAEFYRKQFPHATFTVTQDEDEKDRPHTVLAFGDGNKWTTITIEGNGSGCKFTLASVQK